MTGWGWGARPVLSASLAGLLAAAFAFVPRSTRGEGVTPAADPDVVPPRAIVHLLVAAALLSGLAHTATELERFVLATAEDPQAVRQLYYEASLSSIPMSIAGGVIVSFLGGRHLPWIARLVAMATAVALSGCLVAAASNDPAVVMVAIAAVNACSAFVFAVLLAAIGCWVASRRGIRTAVASISRSLAGSVITFVVIASVRDQPTLGLACAAPIIAAWIALHVRWSLRAIHAAVSEGQSHAP